MSVAKRIHAWLTSSRPYAAGVEILKNADLLTSTQLFFLELGESSTTRQELLEIMEGLHKEHVAQAATLAQRNVSPPLVTKATIEAERRLLTRTSDGYEGVPLPPQLNAVRENIKGWYKERSFLCGRLEILASDDDRLRDALRIKELDGFIKSGYARLDAFSATGRDPGEQQAVTRNSVELVQRLKNVQSYLSRVRNGKRSASPAKLAKWQEEEAEILKLIDALPEK